jgi:hypothetical protein
METSWNNSNNIKDTGNKKSKKSKKSTIFKDSGLDPLESIYSVKEGFDSSHPSYDVSGYPSFIPYYSVLMASKQEDQPKPQPEVKIEDDNEDDEKIGHINKLDLLYKILKYILRVDFDKPDFADKELVEELTRDGSGKGGSSSFNNTDNFWKGYGSNFSDNGIFGIIGKILKFIEYPFAFLKYFIKKMGIYTCNYFSNESTDNEKRVVISVIMNIGIAYLCVFILYNWFYLFIYRDKMSDPAGPHFILKKIDKNDLYNIPFLYWTLRFVIAPLEVFDVGFRKIFCTFLQYFNKSTNTNITWLLILLLSIIFVYNTDFLNLFYESLNITFRGKKTSDYGPKSASSQYYPIFYAIISISVLIYYIDPRPSQPENIRSTLTWYLELFSYYGIFLYILAICLNIFIGFFMVGIPGILVSLYVAFYSFFSMLWFSGGASITETIKKIDDFVEEASMFNDDLQRKLCPTFDECQERTILQKILYFFKLIFDICFKYLFKIYLLVIFFGAIKLYSKSINNTKLKLYLIYTTIIIIMGILVAIFKP